MRWLLLLALTGCFSTTETTTALGVHVEPPFIGPVGDVALHVTESYGTVHVDASRARRCFREVRQTFAHDTHVSTGALVDVVGAVLSAGHDTMYEDRTISVTARDCPIAARRAIVELVLPSGRKLRARTDDQGLVSIAVPASEPDQGTVIVRSADSEARISYSRGVAVAGAPAAVESKPRATPTF